MSTAQRPAENPDDVPAGRFALRIEAVAEREVRLQVRAADFNEAMRELRDAGARFITVFLAETPELALTAVLAFRGELMLVQAAAGADGLVAYRRMGGWWPATAWPEREMIERDRRVSSDREDPHRPLTRPDPDLIERAVGGLDVFTIPYGPVRSGVFEAIQFQIETGGEDLPRLQTRPFFKHRGIEDRFTGLRPRVGVHVAERVAGIASCAYAAAFSQAVERAVGAEAPPRAQRWRAIHCELERLACHLDVIAKEAETTALYVGQARFQILKERVQRLRARLSGSRFGRGAIIPGGVRADVTVPLDDLCAELDDLERDLERDRRLFVGTSSMTDRLIGGGHLDRALVEDYCGVGPLARGSGVSTDARHERPYGEYRRLGLRVVVRREGDAMARINVRFGEMSESLRLIGQATEQLRRCDGDLLVPLPKRGSG
ncbi:MAG: NADH-quinone oxidoreductase subunit D, partial [Solirubrobacteraceae bacterium]